MPTHQTYNNGLNIRAFENLVDDVPDELAFEEAQQVAPNKIVIRRGENQVPFGFELWSDVKRAWWWKVKQNWRTLERCPAPYNNVVEIVLEAVKQNPWALRLANHDPEGVRNFSEVVLPAVRQKGLALEYASGVECGVRNDRTVVTAAVAQNGLALQYAQPSLLENWEEITLTAVKQNGSALQYAPARLRAAPHIQMAAIAQNPEARKYCLKRKLSEMSEA